jgi:hypothetical protein
LRETDIHFIVGGVGACGIICIRWMRIPNPVCWTFAPNAGAFTDLTYYSSAKAGQSYNSFVTFTGTLLTTIPMPPQGDTTAEMDADFPSVVIWTFQTGAQNPTALNATITGMLDRDLLLLATAFINNNGNVAQLHQLASTYLDATNLVRWQAAFTQAAVTPVVSAYAPGSTASAYLGHPALRQVIHGGGMPPPAPPPTPTTQMTMTEIYLEYRIQPGSTALSALTKALTFIGGKTGLGKAWAAGFAFGTYFYKAMVYIDPSYGYDLITTYGSEYDDSSFFPAGSQGYVENGDGSYTDGYGNVVASLPQTNYGIPSAGLPAGGTDPYTYWDPFGDCLLLLECDL